MAQRKSGFRVTLLVTGALLFLSITTSAPMLIKADGFKFHLLATALFMVLCSAFGALNLYSASARKFFGYAWQKISHLPGPFLVFLGLVLLYQLVCLMCRTEVYPFTDVGMFRGARQLEPLGPEVKVAKYFFRSGGGHSAQVQIVDPRREHIPFRRRYPMVKADQLFSVRPYDNMHKKDNYLYLKNLMAPYTDSLGLGLQVYNFRTGLDTFYTSRAEVMHMLQQAGMANQLYFP